VEAAAAGVEVAVAMAVAEAGNVAVASRAASSTLPTHRAMLASFGSQVLSRACAIR
jgi:hypothetical protein